jgi:hypothetical protein
VANGNLYGWQGWTPIPPPGFWVGGSLTAPTVGGLPGIPDYSYANFFTFDFDKDTATLDAKYDSVYNNTDPDLRPFQSHGGKTIFYQGWGDVLVNPVQQIDYYNSVVRNQGGLKKTRGFYRLFMAPGMGHCLDGPGPTSSMEPTIRATRLMRRMMSSRLWHSRQDRIDHVIFDKGTSTFLDRRLATRLLPHHPRRNHQNRGLQRLS